MSLTDFFFIGDKKKPTFMIEINRDTHILTIFTPDKYSKKSKLEFFETYYLGNILFQGKYKKLAYKKNDKEVYDAKDGSIENAGILSEMIIQTKKMYFFVKDNLYEKEIE